MTWKSLIVVFVLSVLVLAISLTAWHYRQSNQDNQNYITSLEQQMAEQQRPVLLPGVDSSRYKQIAAERRRLSTENAQLQSAIDQSHETIRSLTEIAGDLSAQVDSLETRDSLTVTGTHYRTFHYQDAHWNLSGYFATTPPFPLYWNSLRYHTRLTVAVTQQRTGHWAVYVDTHDPGFLLDSVRTQVQPYHAPWYTRIKIGMLLGIGEGPDGTQTLTAGIGVGFGRQSLYYTIEDDHGIRRKLLYNYTFSL